MRISKVNFRVFYIKEINIIIKKFSIFAINWIGKIRIKKMEEVFRWFTLKKISQEKKWKKKYKKKIKKNKKIKKIKNKKK